MSSPFPGMDPYLEDPAFRPDFHLTFIGCWREAVADLLPEPYEARLEVRVKLMHREARIEILHRPDRTLVAVLEMLSPWNKTGNGFQEYRSKRKAVLLQKVHLVELDLLLGGNRLPHLRPLPAGDYYAFVSRADNRPNCDVYAWTVRQPLPTIPIPLRAPDPDLHIDLGAVFKVAYERGRYARSLRYGQPPLALLNDEDKKWAMEISSKN